MMRHLDCYSIVWISTPLLLLRFMKYRNIICSFAIRLQGQVALEQAVAFAPDNYWYSQGLVSLYQQQNELDKAAALLEKMVTRFPSKQDLCSAFLIFTVARRSIMMSFLH